MALNIYCTECKARQEEPLNTPHLESDKKNWTETGVECFNCGNLTFYIKKQI